MLRAPRLLASLVFLASAALAALIPACSGDVTSTGSGTTTGTGTGGDGGSGAGGPLCAPSKVGLAGSLEGAEFEDSYPWTTSQLREATFQSFFKTQGDLVLFGESDFVDGATVAATGILRTPAEGPSGGVVYCAGAGSSLTWEGSDKRFELASLSRLGACPGAPVSGQVTACLGASGCIAGHTFEGALGDVSFNWSDNVTGWGGAFDVFQVRVDNDAIVAIDISQDTVIGGLLVMPPDGDDPRAIYCIGAGSLEPGGPQPNGIKITLTSLSRLGTCADASPVMGAVSGCTH